MTRGTEYYKMKGLIGKHSPRPKVSRKQQLKVSLQRGASRLGSGLKTGTLKLARASGRGLKKAGVVTGKQLKKEVQGYVKSQRRAVRRAQFREPRNEFGGFENVGMDLGFNDPWGTYKKRRKKKRKGKNKGVTIVIR